MLFLMNNSRYDVQKQGTISLLYSATTGDVTALRRFHAQVKKKIFRLKAIFSYLSVGC